MCSVSIAAAQSSADLPELGIARTANLTTEGTSSPTPTKALRTASPRPPFIPVIFHDQEPSSSDLGRQMQSGFVDRLYGAGVDDALDWNNIDAGRRCRRGGQSAGGVHSSILSGDFVVNGEAAVARSSLSRRTFLKTTAAGLGALGLLLRRAGVLLAGGERLYVRPPTALVSDAICNRHLPNTDRAECPQRYDAVLRRTHQQP